MGPDGGRAAARFARGCRCFAIQVDGGIVSYGWHSTSREWIGELGLWITPRTGEAYVWNCFTLEPHRRRGHYRSLLRGLVALPGARRLWIGSIDIPAEKADVDAGFRPVLLLDVTRFGPLRRLKLEPDRSAPPELADESRARLGLAGWSSLGLVRARVH